jgi:hypothetical protein
VDVGNREVNNMVMMPPPPPLPMLDSSRWAEQMQDYAIAYGRAVAEACAVLVEQYPADPDVTDGIAAAIREMAKESGK